MGAQHTEINLESERGPQRQRTHVHVADILRRRQDIDDHAGQSDEDEANLQRHPDALAADTATGEVSPRTFHRGPLLASGSASSSPPVCPASSFALLTFVSMRFRLGMHLNTASCDR